MYKPRREHWDATIRVLRYLKSSPGQGILFRSNTDLQHRAYCDSDWASCPITCHSLSGYFIFLGFLIISWKTKKQHTVSHSLAKAEYRSMAITCCELKWLCLLLQDLRVPISSHTPLFYDNQAAL